jgi:hypothetical protein
LVNKIYYNTSNVGIGTTDPTNKLHLFDEINEPKLIVQNNKLPVQPAITNSSLEFIRRTTTDVHTDFKMGNYNGDFKIISSISGSDVDYFKITTSGGPSIYNPTGSPNWTTTSDKRIKENIEVASYDKCYENISKVDLYRFNYIKEFNNINKDINQLGFIAQSINEILPKAVSSYAFNNNDLNIPDLLSIDITQINYSLYGAVKKLIEFNDYQAIRIKKLEELVYINTLNNSNLPIDTSNIALDTSNLSIDTSNLPIDTSNFPIDTSNFPIDTNNIALDTSNILLDTSNLPIDTSNFPIDISNILLDTSNFPIDTSNFPIDTSNFPIDTSNIALDTSNLSIDTSNLPIDTSNFPIDTSNILLDTSNFPIDTSNLNSTSSNIQIDTSNLNTTSSNLPIDTSNLPIDTSNLNSNTSNINSNTSNIEME